MICDGCFQEFDAIVDCPCGISVCRECFYVHECGQQFDAKLRHGTKVKPTLAEFTMRPYQQQALDAVIEELK